MGDTGLSRGCWSQPCTRVQTNPVTFPGDNMKNSKIRAGKDKGMSERVSGVWRSREQGVGYGLCFTWFWSPEFVKLMEGKEE